MYARTNKSHRGLMLFHQNRCQVLALRVYHVLMPSISQTLQLSNLGLCRDVCVYLKSSFCMSAFPPVSLLSFLLLLALHLPNTAEIDNTCSNYEGLASLLSLTAVATIFSYSSSLNGGLQGWIYFLQVEDKWHRNIATLYPLWSITFNHIQYLNLNC